MYKLDARGCSGTTKIHKFLYFMLEKWGLGVAVFLMFRLLRGLRDRLVKLLVDVIDVKVELEHFVVMD